MLDHKEDEAFPAKDIYREVFPANYLGEKSRGNVKVPGYGAKSNNEYIILMSIGIKQL